MARLVPSGAPRGGPIRPVESAGSTENGAQQSDLDQLESDLGALESEQFVLTVCSVIAMSAGDQRARTLGVLLRALLHEDAEVESLAGAPANLREHLNGVLEDIAIKSEAHRAVLDEEMYDSSAVASALGHSGVNPRDAASDLRRKGALLGVRSGNRYLYPAFQFDLVERRVRDTVAQVNRHLDGTHDPWGVSSWWVSPNPRLGWDAPKDLLGTDRERDLMVLAGAEYE